MTPSEDFGRRVRQRRLDLGLSQQQIADRMREHGFSWRQTTVSRTEQNQDRPLLFDEAVALAAVLGMPLVGSASAELLRVAEVDAGLRARKALAEIARIAGEASQ